MNKHLYLISYIRIPAGGKGDWDPNGCRTMYDDSNPDEVTCECYHLTNFACLVDTKVIYIYIIICIYYVYWKIQGGEGLGKRDVQKVFFVCVMGF